MTTRQIKDLPREEWQAEDGELAVKIEAPAGKVREEPATVTA